MTNQDQSCLRFSLEESIWFQKGKEVDQLHSISIEPSVTITERNQYVVIEGTLLVTGEYEGTADIDETEDESGFNQIQQRYIQHVFRKEEDGMYLFHHTFPVDISIPTSRVFDRGAIEVEIASFDYRMPERSCIKLMAELIITGIYDGEQTAYDISNEEQESNYVYRETPLSQDESMYLNTNESFLYNDSPAKDTYVHSYNEMESSYIPLESFIPNDSYSMDRENSQEVEWNYSSTESNRNDDSDAISSDTNEEPESLNNLTESYVSYESYARTGEEAKESDMDLDEQVEDQDDFYEQLYSHPVADADRTIISSQVDWNSTNSSLSGDDLSDDDETFEASAFAAPKEESDSNSSADDRQQSFQPLQFQSSFQIPMPMFTPETSMDEEEREQHQLNEESIQTLNVGLEDSELVTVRNNVEEDEVESEKNRLEERIQTNFKKRPIYKEQTEEITQKAETGKLSVSLTDFFAKKDTQTQTRLKVCIVQNGESLSDLAARYDVSKQDIIHYNHLEDEDEVEGGKVLYIPQKAVHK